MFGVKIHPVVKFIGLIFAVVVLMGLMAVSERDIVAKNGRTIFTLVFLFAYFYLGIVTAKIAAMVIDFFFGKKESYPSIKLSGTFLLGILGSIVLIVLWGFLQIKPTQLLFLLTRLVFWTR
ncbi:hypothetical protein [Helicobacter felis]|uniref:hypothetical protein n=1 Tax=Helicobacter felis TaxID=214 RepID=UPI000CEE8619|nr:hypothetical protein [Helicobacter felis]